MIEADKEREILRRLTRQWSRVSALKMGDGRQIIGALKRLKARGLVESKMDGAWLVWRLRDAG